MKSILYVHKQTNDKYIIEYTKIDRGHMMKINNKLTNEINIVMNKQTSASK